MKAEYHWSQLDHLRRVTTEQATRIARLERDLVVERAKRLRAEQSLAIVKQDRDAWARATAELMACGVSLDELEAA